METKSNYPIWESHILPITEKMKIQLQYNGRVLCDSCQLSTFVSQLMGWLAIVLLNCVGFPALVSVLLEQSDTLPTVDILLFVWTALIAMLIKSVLDRNLLYVTTICLGFAAQAFLMSLVIFK